MNTPRVKEGEREERRRERRERYDGRMSGEEEEGS